MDNFDQNLLPNMLPIYYSKYFPQNIFCRWLACGSSPQPLSHRELSFTLADDVYLRYLSISNQKELQTCLQKKCPYKLDVGAVYNIKPSLGRHDSVVLARELVFDIDLTDYDEVRTCCQEAKVCDKCWMFIVIACEIIDKVLKDDFGFHTVLWVHSGRRGVHCWVSDYVARILDGPARAAVAGYLSVITGGDNKKKVFLGNDCLHSSIRRALKIIDKYFDQLVQEQDFFATKQGLDAFMNLIPDEKLRVQVEQNLERAPQSSSSLDRWHTFLQTYNSYCKENSYAVRKMKYLVEEIKLQYCYPRLDLNVTVGFNHLLKSPFSIHPKTGKVCVVFKAETVGAMQPDSVPSLVGLLEDGPDRQKHLDGMHNASQHFQEVVFSLEKAEALRRKLDASTSITF